MYIFALTVAYAIQTNPTVLDEARSELVSRAEAYSARRNAEQERLDALVALASSAPCPALAEAARGLLLGGIDAEFLMAESSPPIEDRLDELLQDEASDEAAAALVLVRFRRRLAEGQDEMQSEVVGRMLQQGREAERAAYACMANP